MFHKIPDVIRVRMQELERLDAEDRGNQTPRLKRLRQISPEVGRFIALLAAMAPEGRYIEIGTSAGYSALWLALACRMKGRKLTTFELLDAKIDLARKTFEETGVWDVVELVQGDATQKLVEVEEIGFCFLDGEKEVYERCYDLVVPRLVPGGVLVADNAISHQADLDAFLEKALHDHRVDALIVPIGQGELICRRK